MRPRLACIFLLLASCGPKADGGDGGVTSTSSGTTGDATTEVVATATTSTTDVPICPDPNSYFSNGECFCEVGYDWCAPEDASDLSCCLPGTSSSPTTSDGSGGSAGDETAGGVELCADFCARLVACGLDGAFDGCPCEGLIMGAKCVAAWETTVQCFNMASCMALGDGVSPCWSSYELAIEQCILGEDGCETFILNGGDPEGSCTFGEDCLDQPEKLVHCDEQQCICSVADQEVGACPADGVCGDDELIDARIAECCG